MIDFLATAPHYVDHLRPIWEALSPAERGTFYVGPRGGVMDGVPHDALSRGDKRRPILVVAHGDLKLARAVGRRHLALGQHGAGQSYSTDHQSYPGGKDQADVSLFLVPNETAAKRTRDRYPKAVTAIIGCPKLDTLPRRRPLSPVVAVSFHFDTTIAPETRSAFRLYRAHVAQLSRTVKVIGHAHPKAARLLDGFYRANRIETVRSFTEVLDRATIYVCDNSSSLFEFASTGRNVVVLNAPMYRRNVEHGLRFWAASGVGVNVDMPRDLQAGVARALAGGRDITHAREAALDLVYQPRKGGAKLAVAALRRWTG